MNGATSLAIALFLGAIVANSTVRLTSRELLWSTVLMGGFGVTLLVDRSVMSHQACSPAPARHNPWMGTRQLPL